MSQTSRIAANPWRSTSSEGKTDPLYTAHSYHTKVPHKAIMRYILHYTEPGDVVLDGFAGSGMTGVAAQMCFRPNLELKGEVERERKAAGLAAPHWGVRRAILNDLGPAATFIAANYNLPVDIEAFGREATRILREIQSELGWMYATKHIDGVTIGRINYTVWSQVFSCPACGKEIIFLKESLDPVTKRVYKSFPCPACNVLLTKDTLERVMETLIDPVTHEPFQRVRFIPIFLNYNVGSARYEKEVDEEDLLLLDRIAAMPYPALAPTAAFPISKMSHGSRLAPKGFTSVHHLYLPRAIQALGALWSQVEAVEDVRLRHMLLFWAEQAVWGISVLNRYQPIQQGRPGGSQVNRQLTGVYYVSSQVAEVSPRYNLENKLERLSKAFHLYQATEFFLWKYWYCCKTWIAR